jgi:hypothetical protein
MHQKSAPDTEITAILEIVFGGGKTNAERPTAPTTAALAPRTCPRRALWPNSNASEFPASMNENANKGAPGDIRRDARSSDATTAAEQAGRSARSGALLVFVGKRRTALQVLFFDGSGRCHFYKRLDQRTFRVPYPPRPAQRRRARVLRQP